MLHTMCKTQRNPSTQVSYAHSYVYTNARACMSLTPAPSLSLPCNCVTAPIDKQRFFQRAMRIPFQDDAAAETKAEQHAADDVVGHKRKPKSLQFDEQRAGSKSAKTEVVSGNSDGMMTAEAVPHASPIEQSVPHPLTAASLPALHTSQPPSAPIKTSSTFPPTSSSLTRAPSLQYSPASPPPSLHVQNTLSNEEEIQQEEAEKCNPVADVGGITIAPGAASHPPADNTTSHVSALPEVTPSLQHAAPLLRSPHVSSLLSPLAPLPSLHDEDEDGSLSCSPAAPASRQEFVSAAEAPQQSVLPAASLSLGATLLPPSHSLSRPTDMPSSSPPPPVQQAQLPAAASASHVPASSYASLPPRPPAHGNAGGNVPPLHHRAPSPSPLLPTPSSRHTSPSLLSCSSASFFPLASQLVLGSVRDGRGGEGVVGMSQASLQVQLPPIAHASPSRDAPATLLASQATLAVYTLLPFPIPPSSPAIISAHTPCPHDTNCAAASQWWCHRLSDVMRCMRERREGMVEYQVVSCVQAHG